MLSKFTIPYGRLVMALFASGMIAIALVLFWITYLNSRSLAEHEIARSAKAQAAIVQLVFDQHLDQLETQIRSITADTAIAAAIQRRSPEDVTRIAEQASHRLNNAVLDILLIDLPDQPDWVNVSLGMIDTRDQIPAAVRPSLPPDSWVFYADHDAELVNVTAAISLPVLKSGTGEIVAKIVGGITITGSFNLPNVIAQALDVSNLGLFYDGEMIAGLGDIATDVLPEPLRGDLAETVSAIKGNTLYIATPVERSLDGHILTVVFKQSISALPRLEDTFAQLIGPFLVFTILLTTAIAVLVNRLTSASLARLLNYANVLSRDHVPAPYRKGIIREFNQLATNLQNAFDVARERDAQFRELIDGSLHGVYIHMNYRMLYANSAFLEILGYSAKDMPSLMGAPLLTLYDPEEHSRLKNYYKLRETGKAPRSYEVRARHKDGHVVWLEQHAQIVEWNGARAYYVTATDISARKRQTEWVASNASQDA